jgi:hypothetical protein
LPRNSAAKRSSALIKTKQDFQLAKQLNDLITELNKFVETDVANLNKQLREGGLQFLNPGKRVEPPQ